ncbi:MAG: hypothetical protein ACJAUL_003948 [Paraglaciecola sp.]|jgi:hypothetical protein
MASPFPEHDLPPPSPGYTLVSPRSCTSKQVLSWFTESIRIFKLAPGAWIGAMVVWFIMMLFLSMIPLIGSFLSSIGNYVLIAGLMIGAQAVHDGHKFEVKYLFAGFAAHLPKLIFLSVIATVISALVMWLTIGPIYLDLLMSDSGTLPSGTNIMELSLSFLIAMALLIPLMMALWFAPVLIVLQNLSVLEALRMSFKGCFINTLPFLVYGLITLPFFILGVLTLGLGLLVIMPVIFISIFVSYRQLFLIDDGSVIAG